mgnify:CR=1 FL=1
MSEYQFETLAKLIAQAVKEFYKDPENLKKFEEWRKLNEGKH